MVAIRRRRRQCARRVTTITNRIAEIVILAPLDPNTLDKTPINQNETGSGGIATIDMIEIESKFCSLDRESNENFPHFFNISYKRYWNF